MSATLSKMYFPRSLPLNSGAKYPIRSPSVRSEGISFLDRSITSTVYLHISFSGSSSEGAASISGCISAVTLGCLWILCSGFKQISSISRRKFTFSCGWAVPESTPLAMNCSCDRFPFQPLVTSSSILLNFCLSPALTWLGIPICTSSIRFHTQSQTVSIRSGFLHIRSRFNSAILTAGIYNGERAIIPPC